MKRFIILVALMVIGISMPHEASAQFNLGKALNSLLGNDDEPSRYETLKTNAPQQKSMLGTWYYASAKVEYFGNNVLADYAIDQLDDVAQSLLKDYGVDAGYFSLTLNYSGKITGTMGYDSLSGKYTYDKNNASVNLAVVIEGVDVVCSGYVEQYNNRLKFYLNANDVLKAYEKMGIDYSSYAISLAREVIGQFDDIYFAVSFSK